MSGRDDEIGSVAGAGCARSDVEPHRDVTKPASQIVDRGMGGTMPRLLLLILPLLPASVGDCVDNLCPDWPEVVDENSGGQRGQHQDVPREVSPHFFSMPLFDAAVATLSHTSRSVHW